MTPHFNLEHAVKSNIARMNGIDNSPSKEIETNIKYVASCMELFYWLIGEIRSWYRCEKLNSHPDMQGHPESYHLRALAVDFRANPIFTKMEIIYILKGLRLGFIRKVIVYEKTLHVHISFWPPGVLGGPAKFRLKQADGEYKDI